MLGASSQQEVIRSSLYHTQGTLTNPIQIKFLLMSNLTGGQGGCSTGHRLEPLVDSPIYTMKVQDACRKEDLLK